MYDIQYSDGTKHYTFIGSVSQISFPVDVMVDGGDPWLVLSTYYAGDYTPVMITGYNFGSNEGVNVWFNNQFVGSVTTSDQGAFMIKTTVPESTQGKKTVKAQGVRTGTSAEQSFSQAFYNISL